MPDSKPPVSRNRFR